MAKKRSTIIDAENEFEKDVANASATGTASGSGTGSLSQGSTSLLFKLDADFTREIQSKERVWRNRSIILQSTGKVCHLCQKSHLFYINFNFFLEFCQVYFSYNSIH